MLTSEKGDIVKKAIIRVEMLDSLGNRARSFHARSALSAVAIVMTATSVAGAAQATPAPTAIVPLAVPSVLHVAQANGIPTNAARLGMRVVSPTASGSEGLTAVSGVANDSIDDGALVAVTDNGGKEVRPHVKATEIVTAAVPGSPVPEPTTWAMLLVGLGVVTLRIRGMADRSNRIH